MTQRVLHLDSSIFGRSGASAELSDYLISQLQTVHGPLSVIRRDLAANPPPHLTLDTLSASASPPELRSEEQRQQAALADRLIAEFMEADIVVVAAPMYNFSIPSSLKAWIDHVARAGVTFKYTEQGSVGLAGGKTVYLLTSSGGVHRDRETDGVVPYLRTIFTFFGITDLRVVYAEGVNMGLRHQAVAEAKRAITQLVEQKEVA